MPVEIVNLDVCGAVAKVLNDSRMESSTVKQRFPFRKYYICETNPKFPYRDVRHYIDPCCNFPRTCNYGEIAKLSLEQHQSTSDTSHSPLLPTNHPWFHHSKPPTWHHHQSFTPAIDFSSCVISLIVANHRLTNSQTW